MSEELRVYHDRCDEHDPCEGNALHIRARDAKGCAQFQDGSWFTKDRGVCWGAHPGLPGKKRPDFGVADVTRVVIEAGLAR